MYNVQECNILYNNHTVICEALYLIDMGKYLHDLVILLRGEVCAHKGTRIATWNHNIQGQQTINGVKHNITIY